MRAALVQAAPPTARAMRWSPLLLVTILLLGASLLARGGRGPVEALTSLGAAALASVVVASLHDPAARLLAAVPLSAFRRSLLRLGLVMLPVLVAWSVALHLLGADGPTGSVAPLLALSAAGVAVGVWAPAARGSLLGALVPVAWYVLGLLTDGGLVADVASWWQSHPWVVLAFAGVAVVLGGRRS